MKHQTGRTEASKAPTVKAFIHLKTQSMCQHEAVTVHGGDSFQQLASSCHHEQSWPPSVGRSQSYSTSSSQRAPKFVFPQRVASLSDRLFHAICNSMRKKLNLLFRHKADRTRRNTIRDWTTKAGCNFGVACQDGRVLNFGQACAEGLVRFPHAPPPRTRQLKHAYTVHGNNFFATKEVRT